MTTKYVYGLLLLLTYTGTGCSGAREFTTKPNVILIIVDDQGYGDLSCYPHLVDVNTPYIDSLASSGIRFSNGYATHHTCAPSRAAILSGRYQQRLGFYEIWEVQKGIPEKEKLLPQYLKEAGYHTALIGKWHLGEKAYNHPTAKGYDRFYGFLGGMHDYFDPFIGDSWEGGARGFAPIFDQTDTVRDINYLTIEFTDQALGFIENCGSLPFFLTLSYNAPHVMLQAPPEYIERYEGTKGKYRMIRAMNKVLDDQIGRLLHFLEARDLRKNTMIIYVSDNGGTRINHNWKLKGAKSWFYEGGIRVPFIISYPVVLPSRTVFDAPVSILDIFPTVLAAAGIADPKDKEPDGKNLLPFLIRNHGPDPHEFLYWSSDPYFDRWAVRNGDWKAIRESEDLNGKPGVALYNLRNDVGEEKNLIGRYPEKFKELERLYRKWIGGMPPSLVGDDEWTPNGNGWMYKYKESK